MVDLSQKEVAEGSREPAEDRRLQEAIELAEERLAAATRAVELVGAERWFRSRETQGTGYDELLASMPPEELQLATAERILSTLKEDALGLIARLFRPRLWSLTIPAGVSDIDAMRALNAHFAHRSGVRGVVLPQDFQWYAKLGGAGERDASQAREIRIDIAVRGTAGESRLAQEEILAQRGLRPAQAVEQALVLAAYACRNDGRDLARGSALACATTGWLIRTDSALGIRVLPPQPAFTDPENPPISGVPRARTPGA